MNGIIDISRKLRNNLGPRSDLDEKNKNFDSKLVNLFWITVLCSNIFLYPMEAAINDEALGFVIVLILFFHYQINRFRFFTLNTGLWKISNLLIMYCLINSLISSMENYSVYKLRWIVFFVFIFSISNFKRLKMRISEKNNAMVNLAIFYCIVLMSIFTILFIFGTSWETLQGTFLAGPTYAAFPICFFLSVTYWRFRNKQNDFRDFVLLALSTVLIELFDSRFLLIAILSLVFLILLDNWIPIHKRLIVVGLVFAINFFSPIFHSVANSMPNFWQSSTKSTQITKVPNTQELIKSQEARLSQAISTLSNPVVARPSDVDRLVHIKCAFTVLQNEKWAVKLFGVGNEEFHAISGFRKCIYGDDNIEINKTRLHSVGISVFVLEYGGLGCTLLLISFLIQLFTNRRSSQRRIVFYLAFIFILSLLTFDGLDMVLFWLYITNMFDWSRKL